MRQTFYGVTLGKGRALEVVIVLLAWSVCLFAGSESIPLDNVFGSLWAQVGGAIQDRKLQWVVFLTVDTYFGVFLIRNRCLTQRRLRFPALWLLGLVALTNISYASTYMRLSTQSVTTASMARVTHALTLMYGVALGQAASLWLGSHMRRSSTPDKALRLVIATLVVVLVFESLFHAFGTNQKFYYRGQVRWAGFVGNPNTFGLLMGTGLVLSIGSLLAEQVGGVQHTYLALLLLAACITGLGCIKSYSRGAWLATVVGLVYLILQMRRGRISPAAKNKLYHFARGLSRAANVFHRAWLRHHYSEEIKRNLPSFWAICFASCVLVFWTCRDSEHVLVRRALSIGNRNDFSWRNRLAAWEGALQMMADRPWLGFGWNEEELFYEHYYCLWRVGESGAIRSNDFLRLAITTGIPALMCFLAYVGFSLFDKSEIERREWSGPSRADGETTHSNPRVLDHAKAHCYKSAFRAGAAILLVGFWFDGGLFEPPTAATFWVCLELGRHN